MGQPGLQQAVGQSGLQQAAGQPGLKQAGLHAKGSWLSLTPTFPSCCHWCTFLLCHYLSLVIQTQIPYRYVNDMIIIIILLITNTKQHSMLGQLGQLQGILKVTSVS